MPVHSHAARDGATMGHGCTDVHPKFSKKNAYMYAYVSSLVWLVLAGRIRPIKWKHSITHATCHCQPSCPTAQAAQLPTGLPIERVNNQIGQPEKIWWGHSVQPILSLLIICLTWLSLQVFTLWISYRKSWYSLHINLGCVWLNCRFLKISCIKSAVKNLLWADNCKKAESCLVGTTVNCALNMKCL